MFTSPFKVARELCERGREAPRVRRSGVPWREPTGSRLHTRPQTGWSRPSGQARAGAYSAGVRPSTPMLLAEDQIERSEQGTQAMEGLRNLEAIARAVEAGDVTARMLARSLRRPVSLRFNDDERSCAKRKTRSEGGEGKYWNVLIENAVGNSNSLLEIPGSDLPSTKYWGI